MTTVDLTQSEKKILKQILQQKASWEIAETLGISNKAVELHRSSMLLKTQSKNVVGLVLWATKNGYSE